jgi:DNA polymerase III subunit delta'
MTVAVTVPVLDRLAEYAPATTLLAASSRTPVHAYLLVGQPSGTTEVGRAFAAALLCRNGGCGECRDCRLALSGGHPDVLEVERVGPAISVDQADAIVQAAFKTPVEGDRKVIVVREAQLMRAEAAAKLLKTVEEPPASTVFVLEAEAVPPELVTIRSRCVATEVPALSHDAIVGRLVADGVAAEVAEQAAAAARGNLGRAMLLAGDADLAGRQDRFATVLDRLDGTGATVAREVDALLAAIDAAATPLRERQAAEVERFEGRGRKELDDRHRRELRRNRTDELVAGLAAMAASARDRLIDGGSPSDLTAVAAIHEAIEALERNPNEALLLQHLLLRLR